MPLQVVPEIASVEASVKNKMSKRELRIGLFSFFYVMSFGFSSKSLLVFSLVIDICFPFALANRMPRYCSLL